MAPTTTRVFFFLSLTLTTVYAILLVSLKEVKFMKLNIKVIMVGIVLVTVFNPLSVNLWSDALVVALVLLSEELINISEYTVIVGCTLIGVGVIMHFDARNRKESKRLKKLKKKKSSKAGSFLD